MQLKKTDPSPLCPLMSSGNIMQTCNKLSHDIQSPRVTDFHVCILKSMLLPHMICVSASTLGRTRNRTHIPYNTFTRLSGLLSGLHAQPPMNTNLSSSSKMLEFQKCSTGGRRDDAVGKRALAAPPSASELGFQHPCKKLGIML